MEVVDGETGEVKEVDSIQGAAAEMIERPPYWRRAYHDLEASDVGPEFLGDLLKAQVEMGAVVEADSANEFNNSRYTSLGYLLAKIKPILNKHGFLLSYGVGRVNTRNDAQQKSFLPIWILLRHAKTGQFERFPFEVPMLKFDIQSYGGLLTYGRRYATEAYLGLKGGADDDGVKVSHEPTPEQLNKIQDGMFGKIMDCEDEPALRKWLSENKQQFEMLGAQREEQLKHAWQGRFAEINGVKPKTAAKKGKNDV
jgi:hypothetical protein